MRSMGLLQCICALLTSLGFGILFNIKGKNLLFAAGGGLLAWVVFLLFEGSFPTNIFQYFMASVAIAGYSELMAVLRKTPVTVFLVPSMIPLVPGGLIYYAMEALIRGRTSEGMEQCLYTLEVAGAIALGILGASFLIRMIKKALHRFHLL